MTYELWDIEAGRGIARHQDEAVALALVSTLLDRFGVDYAEHLELGIEDADGMVIELVSGSALAARALHPATPIPNR